MPTNVTEEISLSLLLDGVEFNCQVIDLSATLPGETTGESVQVACPDGVVVEPGDTEDGSLSGTVYSDTTDTGITWALMQAKSTGATMTYVLTWFSDQDNTVAFTWSGNCQVATFNIDWAKPRYSRHPIDLTLQSVDIARPA